MVFILTNTKSPSKIFLEMDGINRWHEKRTYKQGSTSRKIQPQNKDSLTYYDPHSTSLNMHLEPSDGKTVITILYYYHSLNNKDIAKLENLLETSGIICRIMVLT